MIPVSCGLESFLKWCSLLRSVLLFLLLIWCWFIFYGGQVVHSTTKLAQHNGNKSQQKMKQTTTQPKQDAIHFTLHFTFTFSRRFYPKRLTVHSGYTFVLSVCVIIQYKGNKPQLYRNKSQHNKFNPMLCVGECCALLGHHMILACQMIHLEKNK